MNFKIDKRDLSNLKLTNKSIYLMLREVAKNITVNTKLLFLMLYEMTKNITLIISFPCYI